MTLTTVMILDIAAKAVLIAVITRACVRTKRELDALRAKNTGQEHS